MHPKNVCRGLALIAVVCSVGCTTLVTPPAKPMQPQAVFLLDYESHASLALPEPDGGVVCYSYGDWRWYGREQRNLFTGVAALCWPTRAALRRQALPSPHRPDEPGAVYEVNVESERVAELRVQLDETFRRQHQSRTTSARGEFAEHPRRYTIVHNSNRVVMDWLRQLGCEVRAGWTLLPRWKIRAPPVAPRSGEPAKPSDKSPSRPA